MPDTAAAGDQEGATGPPPIAEKSSIATIACPGRGSLGGRTLDAVVGAPRRPEILERKSPQLRGTGRPYGLEVEAEENDSPRRARGAGSIASGPSRRKRPVRLAG